MRTPIRLLTLASVFVVACSSTSHPTVDAGARDAAPATEGAHDARDDDAAAASDAIADVDKAATCAATFGDALTNAFGRLDGTVLAVVPTADDACADPNSTHLVLQVTVQGVAYRMVLDVLSSYGNPDVFFYEEDAPLAAGAWSEGWHAGVTLDYVTTLHLHSTQFTEMKETSTRSRARSSSASTSRSSRRASASPTAPT